jgi:hypothetical protein
MKSCSIVIHSAEEYIAVHGLRAWASEAQSLKVSKLEASGLWDLRTTYGRCVVMLL